MTSEDKDDKKLIDEKLGIAEANRDKLNARDWSKAPELNVHNPDTWTTRECEEKRFSGVRVNELTRKTEIWVTGVLRISRSTLDIANNPSILATMHEEAFQTKGSIVSADLKHQRVLFDPPKDK